MELSNAIADGLKDLLKRCTANVRVDDASKGAAFFISHNLLLTCQHVVDGRDEVEVVPFGREGRPGTVVTPNPGLGDDLALIEVGVIAGENIPAVLLDPKLDEGDYYLVGYPREGGRETGQESYTVPGHDRREGEGGQLLQLDPGRRITFGMSGGPVLSLQTGAVVAVTRLARDPQGNLGGSAVAVSLAMERYPEHVAPLVADPPVSTRAWRDAMGREHWQALGRTWQMTTQVDLIVRGRLNKWKICSEVAPDGEVLNGSALGDDVTEAMFSWAQRRRLTGQPEVDLVGRLLARALFPATVGSHLELLSQADDVTVRLHIGSGDDEDDQDDDVVGIVQHGGVAKKDFRLADIPWELAGIPRNEGFLAADPHFRLVRVDDRGNPDPVVATQNQLRVLGVVALPHAWQYPEWHGTNQGAWPTSEAIRGQLREQCSPRSVGAASLDFRGVIDPPNDVLNDILHGRDQDGMTLASEGKKATFDVLHLIGVGRIGPDGPQYAMSYNTGGDFIWAELTGLFGWAAETGVKVVVLQFTGPPTGQRLEPITPSSIGPVLNHSVTAVVLTRFPAHPSQLDRFNMGFYQKLGAGASLPEAVQDGRRRVRDNIIGDDAAGFGCFVLTTGTTSDIRLVPKQSGRTQGGANSQESPPASGGQQGPDDRAPSPTSDSFTTRGW